MPTRILRSRVTHCLTFSLTFVTLVLCASLLRPLPPGAAAQALAPPEVWVDDDYCDGCANDGHTWGSDAFATIQDGINAVVAGGTVHVGIGVYVEHVTIPQDLTLDGADRGSTFLDGGGTGRALQVLTATVSISGLTIQHGSVPDGSGGGIHNLGTLALSNSALISNTALHGGGMDNWGQATLEGCAVELNSALGATSTGGSLLNESGAWLTLTGSTVNGYTDYAGGGIYNHAEGMLIVTDSTVGGQAGFPKSSDGMGAGILNFGLATLTRTSVTGTKDAVRNAGTMSLSGCHVSYSSNLGLDCYMCWGIVNSGTMDVADSVIEHVSGRYSRGIVGSGSMSITRSRLTYLGVAGNYETGISGSAITITHSMVNYNERSSVGMIAHSWISDNMLIQAPIIVGNELVSQSISGTALYLNNHDGHYLGWPEAWVLTDTVTMKRVTDGTLDARTLAGIEVDVQGTTTLFAGRLEGTLGGAQAFVAIPGGYFDVLQHDPVGLSEVTIRYYYPEGPEESVLGLWWWDGAQWRECSDQGADTTDLPGYGGYVWARITAGSVPALGEWTGGPFVAAENWLVLQQGLEGYSGAADTYLYQYEPETNYCNEPLIRVGYKQQNAGLLRFALPSLPADVVFTGATLQVLSRGWSGDNLSIGAYAVTRTVDICQATWERARAGNNWGAPGANDISTDRRPDPESALMTHGNNEWHDFDVSAAVQGWLEGTLPNNGVLLRALGPDELSFYWGSAENETLEYRPRLVIRWRPAPRPTPTPTVAGLNVSGHVRLDSAGGPGVPGVTVYLSLASYPPSHTSTTDAGGYYVFPFVYIPGDEMITVRPEAAGYAFDPAFHYWRHYGGVENSVRDFVAYATTPTPTATVTGTPTPTVVPTATPTLTPTPATRHAYLPLVLRGFVPRR